jgi:hypothetical protein
LVSRQGEKLVQPIESTDYTLAARVGGYSTVLRTITLRVNLGDCETFRLLPGGDWGGVLGGVLSSKLAMQPDLTVRAATVSLEPGRISFYVIVRKALEGTPDVTCRQPAAGLGRAVAGPAAAAGSFAEGRA